MSPNSTGYLDENQQQPGQVQNFLSAQYPGQGQPPPQPASIGTIQGNPSNAMGLQAPPQGGGARLGAPGMGQQQPVGAAPVDPRTKQQNSSMQRRYYGESQA